MYGTTDILDGVFIAFAGINIPAADADPRSIFTFITSNLGPKTNLIGLVLRMG